MHGLRLVSTPVEEFMRGLTYEKIGRRAERGYLIAAHRRWILARRQRIECEVTYGGNVGVKRSRWERLEKLLKRQVWILGGRQGHSVGAFRMFKVRAGRKVTTGCSLPEIWTM